MLHDMRLVKFLRCPAPLRSGCVLPSLSLALTYTFEALMDGNDERQHLTEKDGQWCAVRQEAVSSNSRSQKSIANPFRLQWRSDIT